MDGVWNFKGRATADVVVQVGAGLMLKRSMRVRESATYACRNGSRNARSLTTACGRRLT